MNPLEHRISDTYAALSHGARGCVWGAANPTPGQCVELYRLVVEQRELLKARELWTLLFPLNRFFETEGYTAAVKAATTMVYLDIGEPRAPFRPLTASKRSELRKLLEPLGLLGDAVVR